MKQKAENNTIIEVFIGVRKEKRGWVALFPSQGKKARPFFPWHGLEGMPSLGLSQEKSTQLLLPLAQLPEVQVSWGV
jgi:hypothetical protein